MSQKDNSTPAADTLTRRKLVFTTGASVAVAALAGCTSDPNRSQFLIGGPPSPPTRLASAGPGVAPVGPQAVPPPPSPNVVEKPTYVADRVDPVAYSIADNLFWNDIMMEHATFFVMLMPGPELQGPRNQAQQFQQQFSEQFMRSRALNTGNYIAHNQRSIDLARRFSDWKQEMRERQESGNLMSLVWPLFFTHTAREADRYAARLALYSRGNIEFERPEVVDFWSKTMSEHSAFIAHLLDPQEKMLIAQATQMETRFANPAALRGSGPDPVMGAAQEILDFKIAGERGIRSGMIKSIIPIALADHVRREAVRFIDELRRASPNRFSRL
jgi:hypothetical protein